MKASQKYLAMAVLAAIIAFATFPMPSMAVPVEPVIQEFDYPLSVPENSQINISVKLANSLQIQIDNHDVWIYFIVDSDTQETGWELIFNETTASWKASIPEEYLNCTTIKWRSIQIFTPENRADLGDKITQVILPEIETNPWEMVLIVAFLGVAFVVTELLFKPIRGGRKPAEDEEEEEEDNEEVEEAEDSVENLAEKEPDIRN